MRRYQTIAYFLVAFMFEGSFAATWPIPASGNTVGDITYAYPQPGETLRDVGLRYDMGYHDMRIANPHVDPTELLSEHERLLIPSRFTLPHVPHHGLVINLAQYRLYFFPEDDNVVMTFPVGIGRKGWNTPLGLTKVIAKEVNPTWRPTAKVMADAENQGISLPDALPPGPNNPLGHHVLRLAWPTYLIHGTNQAGGVGERASAGCIRMLPEDIEYLYEHIKIGTPVLVISEQPHS